MTKEKRKELKNKILAEIESVRRDICHLKTEENPISLMSVSEKMDALESITDQGIQKQLLLDFEARLKRLEYALSRVDAKEFGICQICDEPIPYKRLSVLPEATICVECASARA
ncbi:MAG: TraR/DksA family transcriptional regulator [Wolinella sp.]